MQPDTTPAAVLWDMDGTLIDSEPYWIRAEMELADRYGATWSQEDAHAMVGNALPDSGRIFAERTGVPLSAAEIVDALQARVVEQVTHEVPWRPGARELLGDLRAAGVPCALVTMSYACFADKVVAALPAGSFGAVVAGDHVEQGKPHPEPYLKAAARLGVLPGACVALEDSPTGIASARAAGAAVIAIPLMVPIAPAPGLSRITSLAEVSVDDLAAVAGGTVIDTIAGRHHEPHTAVAGVLRGELP